MDIFGRYPNARALLAKIVKVQHTSFFVLTVHQLFRYPIKSRSGTRDGCSQALFTWI